MTGVASTHEGGQFLPLFATGAAPSIAGMGSRGGRAGLAFAVSLIAVASLAFAGEASARNAYVPTAFGNTVAYFPVQTPSPPTVNSITLSGAGSVAITPNGSTAYVGSNTGGVTRVAVATNTAGTTIPVGSGSVPELAVSPDGSKVYASDANGTSVKVISTASNTVTATIPLGANNSPAGIAVSPDGTKLYVVIPFSLDPIPNDGGKIVVIDTATNLIDGDPIPGDRLGSPREIAVTPDGAKAYVANVVGDSVSVIDTSSRAVTSSPSIADPTALAVTPDGGDVYVTQAGSPGTVSVISTPTDEVAPGTIPVGYSPSGIAITPDGEMAYVSNSNAALAGDPMTVSTIDTDTRDAGDDDPVAVGTFPGPSPQAVAIVPDQGPTADFTDTPAQAGSPTSFDASASSDPDPGGSVEVYFWEFGDGNTLATTNPTATHTYAAGGTYDVALTVTDNEGCSDTIVFTGQTAFCNPNTVDPATMTSQVTIAGLPTTPGPTPTPSPAGTTRPTGQQAAALKKCKKKKTAKARKKCKQRAKKLPV
jgi:YVTN family beta-propeller protein